MCFQRLAVINHYIKFVFHISIFDHPMSLLLMLFLIVLNIIRKLVKGVQRSSLTGLSVVFC